jgi:hypothetical protein
MKAGTGDKANPRFRLRVGIDFPPAFFAYRLPSRMALRCVRRPAFLPSLFIFDNLIQVHL